MMASSAGRFVAVLQNECFRRFVPAANSATACLHFGNIYCSSHKHWNPKFRQARKQKVLKIELPDFDEFRRERKMSPDEVKKIMKEKGLSPARPWTERPLVVSCTAGIFEGYVPPEGDGRMSSISVSGAKQKLEWLQKKGRSFMALRKIRNFEEDFDVAEFAEKMQQIYIDAHAALAEKDEDKLHELVTETCYPEMMLNVARKTLRWQFLESLELPRACHVRCTDVITKENVFAQITVRFHSKQTLAVYDRFGRLMHGSEVVAKDVLEYVVFEKHLANQYGQWRIQGKIIPDWMPAKDPVARTFRKVNLPEPPPLVPSPSEEETVEGEAPVAKSNSPQLVST